MARFESQRDPRGPEEGLDALRAAAILAVLGFHAGDLHAPPRWLAPLLQYGSFGVDLFFVLSGFLIARKVFEMPDDLTLATRLGIFWTKRCFRTWPAYYVVLFAFVVVKPGLLHFPFRGSPWPYLFFVQNFTRLEDFVPSWSLCVEEQFYLVFPIVALGLRRVARVPRIPPFVWLLPIVFSVIARWVAWNSVVSRGADDLAFAAAVEWPTTTRLDGIAVGVFLAASERSWSSVPFQRLGTVAGVALIVLTCAGFGPHPKHSLFAVLAAYPLLATGFALCVVGLRGAEIPRIASSITRRAAAWSYGAYLWMALVNRALDHFAASLGPWVVQATSFVAVTLSLGALTRVLVELPLRRVRDRVLSRVSTRHLGAAAPGSAIDVPASSIADGAEA